MTPWVTRLLIANVVMYVLTLVGPGLVSALMFVPAYVLMRPWTLITYMFLHGGIWHLFFNMLGLFFFGPRLEAELGGRDFLLLYFISGLAGALFSFLTPYVAIIGASGAVYGVLLGFAYYWPRDQIFIWGVIPVQARWLVAGVTLLSLWGGFGGGGDGIAHFAHLGGFAGGFLYLKWRDFTSRGARFQRSMATPAARSADVQRWKNIPREGMHEINRAELDRILEKLNTSGVSGLTDSERAFLDRFSQDA
jgi:membrane associated rhomboid family serine protease